MNYSVAQQKLLAAVGKAGSASRVAAAAGLSRQALDYLLGGPGRQPRLETVRAMEAFTVDTDTGSMLVRIAIPDWLEESD